MAITTQMIKELRERTSAGMMDCKKALNECGGDMEKACDWLRQKGLAQVAKRSGRATSEGLVRFKASADGRIGALAEVKCETDFVARGDDFQKVVNNAVSAVLEHNPADEAAFDALAGEDLRNIMAVIGENMSLGRFARLELSGTGMLAYYVHANNKLGVMVELLCQKPETVNHVSFLDLGRNIAMQIAAASPLALESACLDKSVVDRERELYRQKTLEEGKPANIVEKIVDGRMSKFYQEVCLLDQVYIRDDKKTINGLLAEEGKTLGDTLSIGRFVRINLAEAVASEADEE